MPEWSAADVDVASVWAQCGGQALTDPAVAVPANLVKGVVGITRWLEVVDPGALGVRAKAQQLPPAGRVSCGGAARLVRCVDGWLAVSLPRPEDVAAVPAWLATDDADWSTIEAVLAGRQVAATVEQATLLGLACAAVGERVAHGSGVLVESLAAAPPTSLSGLVVANLASLWAGPLAADVLARRGARVITVESTMRPDGARAWPEFFDGLHSRCEFARLDFADINDRARLAQLLAEVDIVIEGSRPRAMQQLGIDARAMVANGPRVWVSITGHGREVPNAHRIAFGDDAAAAGGLVGWVGGEPRFIADAVADPLTGLTAAAAVLQLVERGGRWLVDAPLAGIAATYS